MTLHATLGMVVMAALLLGMTQSDAAATGAHTHGLTASAFAAAVVAAAACYAAGSAVAAARVRRWFDRMQVVGMGMSTIAMGLALVA